MLGARSFLGHGQEVGDQIDAGDHGTHARGGDRGVAGARADVEHAFAWTSTESISRLWPGRWSVPCGRRSPEAQTRVSSFEFMALHGDDDQVPVADRDWFREMIEEPDPGRQLDIYTRNADRKARFADVTEVIRSAAAGDPELAELWRKTQAEFHENQGKIIRSLAAKGGLRPDLSVAEATDLLWTLDHPTVFHMLVTERGWSTDRYRDWLATTLRRQLLPED